jgi:hypothetical protein
VGLPNNINFRSITQGVIAQSPEPEAHENTFNTRLNWNLEMFNFEEGGKLQNSEKTP